MNAKVNKQIIEEASSWFVDFRVGDIDAGRRQKFHDWLRRSPDHIQAYLDIAMTYAELPVPDTAGAIDVQSLIEHARSSADTNIVDLGLRSQTSSFLRKQEPSETNHSRSELHRLPLALAASLVLAMLVGTAAYLYTQRGTYATGIGEQRSLVLADGSTIQLNSLSRVRIRYTDDERRIVLLDGQALFQVAKNAHRPFIVHVNDTQVRAVGTQFDVYRKVSGTIVTVVEGKVSVDFAGSAQDPGLGPKASGLMLAAGEQLQVSALIPPNAGVHALQPVPVLNRVDVSTATAWTQRQLIFENASLSQVAQEFNRYSTRPIILETDAADSFHVSGTYSSTNHESLLRFLRVQPGIRLIESDSEIRITRE